MVRRIQLSAQTVFPRKAAAAVYKCPHFLPTKKVGEKCEVCESFSIQSLRRSNMLKPL